MLCATDTERELTLYVKHVCLDHMCVVAVLARVVANVVEVNGTDVEWAILVHLWSKVENQHHFKVILLKGTEYNKIPL